MLAFSLCSLPWYLLCLIRNGSEFPRVFFVEQQFARFGSSALQHVQPWWFYLPILPLLLYPWFPVLALTPRGLAGPERDARLRLLAVVVVFGFVFFSAAVNKLPGYLLPLLPLVCTVMGFGLGPGASSRHGSRCAAGLVGRFAISRSDGSDRVGARPPVNPGSLDSLGLQPRCRRCRRDDSQPDYARACFPARGDAGRNSVSLVPAGRFSRL